jgi:hypothetical protein
MMPAPNPRILAAFRERLLSGISRSPLLKASVAQTGRLLDCTRLENLEASLGKEVLRGVIGDGQPVFLDFPQRLTPAAETTGPATEEDFDSRTDDDLPARRRAREQKLLEQMLIRIMRHGALAKRETGVHAVWLGYPLLHVAIPEAETPQQLFAPIFLWPLKIELVRRHQGRYAVSRDNEAGPPQFNQAMAVWIRNKLNFDVSAPHEHELQDLSWESLLRHLQTLSGGFPHLRVVDCEGALELIPKLAALQPEQSPRIFNSVVLGYFRWQNQAVLADLDDLKAMPECEPPVAGFITGDALEVCRDEVPAPPEEDRFQVCDADFSQERVLWKARSRPGLVVHGPPGTGKSQTIVNVIADALAKGRTVLMVCQKQAATRVVLERLRKVGLADLCMEVHDPESERTSVFNAIREQVERLPNVPQAATALGRRQQLAGDIAALKQKLDRIAKGLHEQHVGVGLSYRQIKAREGQTFHDFRSARALRSLRNVLTGMSARALDESYGHVLEVGQCFKVGDPLNNPWRHHQPGLQVNPVTQADLDDVLDQLRQLDARHQEQIERFGAGRPLPRNVAEFAKAAEQFLGCLRLLTANPLEPPSVLTLPWLKVIRRHGASQWQEHVRRCKKAVALAEEVADSPLAPAWDQACVRLSEEQLDRLRLQAECVLKNKGHWWRFLNISYQVSRRAIYRMHVEGAGTPVSDAAANLLACLKARKLREQLACVNQTLVPGLDPCLPDATAQTSYSSSAQKSLDLAVWLCEQERAHDQLVSVLDELLSPHRSEGLNGELQRLEHLVQRASNASVLYEYLNRLGDFLLPEALDQARDEVLKGSSIQPWLDRLAAGFTALPMLLHWEIDRRQREEPHRTILEALEDYEQRRTAGENVPVPPNHLPNERYGEWWRALVERTAVEAWLEACHERYPELLHFNPEQHEQMRQQLRKLLKEKRSLEADVIRERWLAKQVSVRDRPWNQLFQLGGPHAKRLRQAIELSLGRGLLKLRPCWLVDPGTAAQIFPLRAGLFDLVIFDEASQCPIECAVPAIFRGKALIVSGDAKQLPPTSFFSTRLQPAQAEEEDVEDPEPSDQVVPSEDRQFRQINTEFLTTVEDLLEASIGNLAEERLLVHYRSDHPRLIEFSNRAFYGGLLEAPPARMRSSNGQPPIQYHHVDGVYANRMNRDEARKVVELLKAAWRAEGESPTIGVVTFNREQRDLIEDSLERECHIDEAFAARYQQELARKDDNQDVGFFVKNLENVQGDERDVMIFSTTFGRNADGQFFRQFGPVGAERGERRLNVAVTRAKHQIIIVGSMPIEEIAEALGGAGQPGANLTPRCYLQLYLAYARAVSVKDEAEVKRILDRLSHAGGGGQAQAGPESPFEEDVLREVQELGYQAHCQVGESGFRIDLAVLHPEPNQGYLLGIECDGASYHSDRAAHLRDVWRETILRSRGWTLHRIWSTEWWYHRRQEQDRLLDAISSARAAAQPPAEPTPAPDGVSLEPRPNDHVLMPEEHLDQRQNTEPLTDQPADAPANVLDENRTLIDFYHEFRVSWPKTLARLGLPENTWGIGIVNNMTLAQARAICRNHSKGRS